MGSWGRVATCAVTIATGFVVACSSFSADPPPANDGGGPSVEGGGPEASLDLDAGSEAGGTSLLADGDFEIPCNAGAWATDNATLRPDPIAHGNKASCRVCSKGAVKFDVHQAFDRTIVRGTTITGDAWMRAVPEDDAGPPPMVVAFVNISKASGNAGTGTSQPTPIDAKSWTHVTATLVVADDGIGGVQMYYSSNDPAGGCFLVDDAALTLTQ